MEDFVHSQPVDTGLRDRSGMVLRHFYFLVLKGEDEVPHLSEYLFTYCYLLL